MSVKSLLVAGLLAAGLFSGHALAVPVRYAGTLDIGQFSGSVNAESASSPDSWSFWTFNARFMDTITITVTPLSAGFDPVMAVWFGAEANTFSYSDLFPDSMNTVLVASADGTPSDPLAGVGEIAQLSFLNIFGEGPFTLAIADYDDGIGTGPLQYVVSATVPEPEGLVPVALALATMTALMRRRRS